MFNDKIVRLSFIVLGALIVVGILVVNIVFYGGDGPTYNFAAKEVKANNLSTDPKELNLETIFINIKSEKYRILKVDMAVRMKSASDKKALEKNMESVRNVLLQYLASMDANRLSSQRGKDDLKEDLADVLESSFGYKIDTIYWKNFILSP